MGGEPWPDLEQQIASGRVKGSWPAARDEWGSWAKKLEVVFVVRIPSDRARDRFVPGRKDVYILSPQDCVDQGDFYFYTNDHIAHCFILKPPSDAAGRRALDSFVQRDEPVRVHYSSSRDGDGGMQDVTMAELRENVAAADVEVVDDSSGFPPKVLSCVAAVARPPDAGDKVLAFHRNIETQREGRQLWEEDVARFTDEEMAAALRAMDQAIPRRYSLTYYFTTKEIAQGICAAGGGLVAADDPTSDRIVVSTRSPVELGWVKNGGSRFQATAGQLLWQAAPADLNQPDGRYAGRLQVMLIVAVPTAVLEDARNQHQRAGLVAIPTELLTDADKYSNAHITKCYALGQGAQLRNAVSAVVALNAMTFGGARGGPPSDVEVGAGANLVANPLSLLPDRPPARPAAAAAQRNDPDDASAATKKLFDAVDTDGSGLIGFDEFAAWWTRRQQVTRGSVDKALLSTMREQWEKADQDGSGDLDENEFAALMVEVATDVWAEAVAPSSGKTYYYHRKTKETRWVEPASEQAVTDFLTTHGLVVPQIKMRPPPPLESLASLEGMTSATAVTPRLSSRRTRAQTQQVDATGGASSGAGPAVAARPQSRSRRSVGAVRVADSVGTAEAFEVEGVGDDGAATADEPAPVARPTRLQRPQASANTPPAARPMPAVVTAPAAPRPPARRSPVAARRRGAALAVAPAVAPAADDGSSSASVTI